MSYNINAAADYYAYSMCGSCPCEDCDEFTVRYIVSEEERRNAFIECMFEAKCDEAKAYDLMYANYKKEYLEKYGDNKG